MEEEEEEEEEEELASCLEEAGWPRPEVPRHIAQLYQHLSKHAHNKFQLSLRRVDIMVSAPAFQAGWQPARQGRSGTCEVTGVWPGASPWRACLCVLLPLGAACDAACHLDLLHHLCRRA